MPLVRFAPLALVVAACHHTSVASSTASDAVPAPLRVHSDVPPRDALRSAADYLGRSGFLVVRMDSTTLLRAEREQRQGELDNTVACTSATAQAARVAVVPTMIIELAALPASAGGSELVVNSHVSAEYLRLGAAPARPRSDRDCRSTGLVERGLVERLSRGQ